MDITFKDIAIVSGMLLGWLGFWLQQRAKLAAANREAAERQAKVEVWRNNTDRDIADTNRRLAEMSKSINQRITDAHASDEVAQRDNKQFRRDIHGELKVIRDVMSGLREGQARIEATVKSLTVGKP